MRVCYFGTYSTGPGYPRNRMIIRGLRENGVEVIECHRELWRSATDKVKAAKGFPYNIRSIFVLSITYLILIIKFFRIGNYDLLIVGYAGHLDIFLARILNIIKQRPLIFDVFLSLYDTIVHDRRLIKPDSLRAKILWLIDKYSCILADMILLDTHEHIDYFVREFGLPRHKFVRVFVGEDDKIFRPVKRSIKNNHFEVLFFGTYITLHGIEYIIKAAKELETEQGIHFTLIGTGPLYEEMNALAKRLDLNNIDLIDRWMDYDELVVYISNADICLGIFGGTEKAKRVIPCKVYDCMAMGKPLITGDSLAARELLVDKENAILCEMEDPMAITNSILLLKKDKELLNKIGKNALSIYKDYASPLAIGKSVLDGLQTRINNA